MARTTMKWFYNMQAWKDIRIQALKRDHFTCAYCGARATEVHHLIELDEDNVHDPKISLNLSNLKSLCHACHTQITMEEHGIHKNDCEVGFHFDLDGNLVRNRPPIVPEKNRPV